MIDECATVGRGDGKTLPDVLDEDQTFPRPHDPQVVWRIEEQDAAYEGQRGALLLGIAAGDGRTRFRLNLSCPPVWDGIAVAAGGVFLSTQDGRLTCWREGRR
jgi:hypothetical protein